MSVLKFNTSDIDMSDVSIVKTFTTGVKASVFTTAQVAVAGAVVAHEATKHLPERAEEYGALLDKALQILPAAFCGMISSTSGKRYTREDLLNDKEGYDSRLWNMFQPELEDEE